MAPPAPPDPIGVPRRARRYVEGTTAKLLRDAAKRTDLPAPAIRRIVHRLMAQVHVARGGRVLQSGPWSMVIGDLDYEPETGVLVIGTLHAVHESYGVLSVSLPLRLSPAPVWRYDGPQVIDGVTTDVYTDDPSGALAAALAAILNEQGVPEVPATGAA